MVSCLTIWQEARWELRQVPRVYAWRRNDTETRRVLQLLASSQFWLEELAETVGLADSLNSCCSVVFVVPCRIVILWWTPLTIPVLLMYCVSNHWYCDYASWSARRNEGGYCSRPIESAQNGADCGGHHSHLESMHEPSRAGVACNCGQWLLILYSRMGAGAGADEDGR
ncbi:hypothetical protein BD289DRAFT_180501 [Coniella lustricola]|uniref:Uncharacterized protein n=1 Tax=Coniella lustricola TaxID=2025994 RepID=A0A2T2ZTF8_9PEZI|nr:hypothetical protein BD289DRAFT_180501 [Coniella lustricola]